MTRAERPRHISKFYSLTNQEWARACHELKPAELKVLYYLRTLDPFGDRPIDIGVRELATTLNCNPGTVSRALKALSQKGWIDLELVRVNVKLKTQSAPVLSQDNTVVSAEKMRSPDNIDDLETTHAISTQHARSPRNNQPLEPLSDKAFRTPHTIQTDQTFKTNHTLAVCVENEQRKEDVISSRREFDLEDEESPTGFVGEQSRIEHTHLLGTFIEAEPEESSAPPLLHKAQELGVNLSDRKLQKAIARFRDRLPDAIAALLEKASTVKYPTRFLEKAILEAWKPEQPAISEFSQWYAAAQQHNCGVIGSTQAQGIQWVFDRNGDRHRWDDLRHLSWDDLRHRLNPSTSPATFWTPYADLSSLIASIDIEICRLGWIPSQIQTFLTQAFGKASRSQLSDDQLAELLNLLQGQAA